MIHKNLTTGIFILTIFLLSCSVEKKTETLGESVPAQPNIIFILADDLGYGDLGVFFQNQREKDNNPSQPWHKTPNLDKMASEGVYMTQHYCSAPVCAPSRASLLSGLHQGHANVRDNQFDKAIADNYTVGNVLQKAGYETVAVGKWGLQGDTVQINKGADWLAHPLKRGFDDYFGYMRHRDGHEHYPKEGIYRDAKEVYKNHENISADLDKCYTMDLWTAYAKKWIVDHSQSKSEKPFFMYLAFDTPHAVIELPTQAYPEAKGLNGGLQWTGEKGHMINTASGEPDSWTHPDYVNAVYDHDNDPKTEEIPWPDTYKRYATSVRRIDDAVGDINQLLIDLGVDSNTLVVFTSDNGPSRESYLPEGYVENTPEFFDSFGPFDGIKRDVWEGGIRVPTIAKWPVKFTNHKEVTTPGMFSDWMATFCDAAGFAAPAKSDGVSLLPAMSGTGNQKESTVYVEYFVNSKTPAYEDFDESHRGRTRKQMQMVYMNNLLGVRYDVQSTNDDFEIYDVVKDPKEINNLAAGPDMENLQAEMKQRVLQLRRPNESAPRPYDGELIPSVVKENTVAGVEWKSFQDESPWIPQVDNLYPSSVGMAEQLSASLLGKDDNLLYCQTFIKIPEDGEYTFSLTAEGTALMRIHDAMVIDADYGYEADSERRGTILLKEGLHPIKVYYKKGNANDPHFNLKWSGPSFDIVPLSSKDFYR